MLIVRDTAAPLPMFVVGLTGGEAEECVCCTTEVNNGPRPASADHHRERRFDNFEGFTDHIFVYLSVLPTSSLVVQLSILCNSI